MTKRKPPDQLKKRGRRPKIEAEAGIKPANSGQQVQVSIGRPVALELTETILRQVSQLGAAQLSPSEAAAILGVAENTFKAFLTRHPEAQEAWETAPPKGRGSVKLVQYKKALAGSVDALKWWGKQHLGQSEKSDPGNTPGVAIQINNGGPLTEDDHARIAANVAGLLG